MEPRFGYDFSRVRVHADSQAAKSAEAINAQAYTVGSNIVFGSNQVERKTYRTSGCRSTNWRTLSNKVAGSLKVRCKSREANDSVEGVADRAPIRFCPADGNLPVWPKVKQDPRRRCAAASHHRFVLGGAIRVDRVRNNAKPTHGSIRPMSASAMNRTTGDFTLQFSSPLAFPGPLGRSRSGQATSTILSGWKPLGKINFR